MKLVLVQPQLSVMPDSDNLGAISERIAALGLEFSPTDIVLLPEGVDRRPSGYAEGVRDMARRFGCHVVGGSRRERIGNDLVNAGLVCDANGTTVGRYEKLRPYAAELGVVRPGDVLGEFEIGGRKVMVLICADFWFADLFQRAGSAPDLVLVAALSVTRKDSPEYSRTLWRHMAVARAYEFGFYVGISDWGHPSGLSSGFPCGVGGFVDPATADPQAFFSATDGDGIAVHELDFDRLDRFREDRRVRGFFWRS